MGGAHPSLFPEKILENCTEIDYIVVGEGEEQLVQLADAIETKSVDNLDHIQSFAYRKDNKPLLNPRKSYLENLNDLPNPAWDLISFPDYYTDHSTWHNPKGLKFHISVPILTSRSCPFSCNFCACYSTMGRKFRKRAPFRIVDEIELLHKKYGQNYFGFIDDNVNLDKQHIIDICSEICRRGLNIHFETTYGTYIASLNSEVIDALASAGCVFVRLPIEHGNDYIRNQIIGKNLERAQIYQSAELLKKKNIVTSSMFIMGFPEDTESTLNDSYQMICDLELDLNYVFNLIPFPGTRVFAQAQRDDLLFDDFDSSALWKGSINLDPVQDEPRFFIRPYQMDLEQLRYYRKLFYSVRMFSKKAKNLNTCD